VRRDVKNGWCVWKKIEKNVEKFLGDEELLFLYAKCEVSAWVHGCVCEAPRCGLPASALQAGGGKF